jgi:hypothetical protein
MRWKGHRATTTAAAAAFPFTQPHVNHFICPSLARLASTSPSSPSSTPFPFPAHRNPTPHQIFHLPPNPSQAEIKARCTSTSISPLKEPPATTHIHIGCRLRARADFPSRLASFTGPTLERAPRSLPRCHQSLRHSPWEIPFASGPRPC